MLAGPSGAPLDAAVLPDLTRLPELDPRPAVVAVDMPIGLSDAGPRECDRRARARLGRPRGSSVFPAPLRPMLDAGAYTEACDLGERADGRRLSRQAWNLLPRIRELDRFLRAEPGRSDWLWEVHPEVSFQACNGGAALEHGKKSGPGREERARLIDRELGTDWRRMEKRLRRREAASDDLLDALIALWSARRVARGDARSLPEEPSRDAAGLPMRIVY